MKTPGDPLEVMLEQIRATTPPLPGSVSREVWRRISEIEARTARPGVWTRIELAFSRPAFATAFLVACVLCGLFIAELRVSRLRAEQKNMVEQNYLQLIDPLLESPPAIQQVALRQ